MLFRTSVWPALAAMVMTVGTAVAAESSDPRSLTPAAPSSTPTDAEIRQILHDRIENAKRGVGIVVGIIDETGRRVVSYGVMDTASGRKVDGDTLFEIGSISKTFTATLLADMGARGEVKLDDPVSDYLPASVPRVRSGGKDVSLKELATHTSGLPRAPANLNGADLMHQYTGYTVENMYAFLAAFDHPSPPSPLPSYSNYGFGLLGVALANRMHTDYATLLRERILAPLGMHHTAIALTPDEQEHFATPHSVALNPMARPNDWQAFAGAGGIRSTVNDMLSYAEAYLGLKTTPLAAAVKLIDQEENRIGDQALGWLVRYNGDVLWHNGMTSGFTSSMYIDKRAHRAVVLLSNAAYGEDDIAKHILYPFIPVRKLEEEKQYTAIKFSDPKAFDKYAGRYQMGPDFYIDFMREGDQYFTQGKGQNRIEIRPYSESAFFLVDVPLHVQFTRDDKGLVTGVIVHQDGDDVYGRAGNKIR